MKKRIWYLGYDVCLICIPVQQGKERGDRGVQV